MQLEKQVCSLELAKKLKELGVKQESLFYWYYVKNLKSWEIFSIHEDVLRDKDDVSAFTVAELGEMLPKELKINISIAIMTSHNNTKKWCVYYYTPTSPEGSKYHYGQLEDTEADARAKMLIYLIENKLITL